MGTTRAERRLTWSKESRAYLLQHIELVAIRYLRVIPVKDILIVKMNLFLA